jgi:hypothetical protein
MQLISDLDKANISKAGCRWLGKTNWKNFIGIRLCIIYVAKTFFGRVADI